jgi:hypothetical protein
VGAPSEVDGPTISDVSSGTSWWSTDSESSTVPAERRGGAPGRREVEPGVVIGDAGGPWIPLRGSSRGKDTSTQTWGHETHAEGWRLKGPQLYLQCHA